MKTTPELEALGIFFERDMSGSANLIDKSGALIDYDELPQSIKDLIDAYVGDAETFEELN